MLYSKLSKVEKEHFNKYPIPNEFHEQVKQNKLNVFLKQTGYNLYDTNGVIVYQVSMKDNDKLNTKISVENNNNKVVVLNKYVDYSNSDKAINFFLNLKNTLDNNKEYKVNLFGKFTLSGNVETILNKIKSNIPSVQEEFNKILSGNVETLKNDYSKAKAYVRNLMKEYNITNVNREIKDLLREVKNNSLNYEEFRITFDNAVLTRFKKGQEELNKCSNYINKLKTQSIYKYMREEDKTYIYSLLDKIMSNEIEYEDFKKGMSKIIRKWQARQLLSKYYNQDNDFPKEIQDIVNEYCNDGINKQEFVEELIEYLKDTKLEK